LAKLKNPGSHYQLAKVYVCRSLKNAIVGSLANNREIKRTPNETEEKQIYRATNNSEESMMFFFCSVYSMLDDNR
jgi:hypothetical protein